MIESIENGLQIAVLIGCTSAAIFRALKYRSRTWTMLSFFYGSWMLGDIYWLVCLVFYDNTPQVSVVSDLSWYAAYIFLYMLLRHTAPPEGRREKRLLPWIGPLFTTGLAIFFMQYGDILSNLIYAELIGLLLFATIRRLMDGDKYNMRRSLCILILIFCLLEYTLWTSSCFFSGGGIENPYYWIDFLMTVCFVFFIPATGKRWRHEFH